MSGNELYERIRNNNLYFLSLLEIFLSLFVVVEDVEVKDVEYVRVFKSGVWMLLCMWVFKIDLWGYSRE